MITMHLSCRNQNHCIGTITSLKKHNNREELISVRTNNNSNLISMLPKSNIQYIQRPAERFGGKKAVHCTIIMAQIKHCQNKSKFCMQFDYVCLALSCIFTTGFSFDFEITYAKQFFFSGDICKQKKPFVCQNNATSLAQLISTCFFL